MTDPRVSKLPAWARSRIKNLEMERDAAIQSLRDFQDGQTVSPVYYQDNICTGEEQGPTEYRHYLQTHSVTFQLGPRREDTVDILLRPEEGELQISAWHSLIFRPVAANSIRIARIKP